MPEYVGDSSNQACWLIWGIRECSLFLSDFSGGDVLIAATDSGDFKEWIIMDALNGKHALKRMNASFECGIGELMDAVNKDMQRREK